MNICFAATSRLKNKRAIDSTARAGGAWPSAAASRHTLPKKHQEGKTHTAHPDPHYYPL